MTFVHEAIAANPVSADADKALQRALFTRRYTYNLSDAENGAEFIAADPATGVMPLYIRQQNVVYQLDASDTTTAAGAGTCVVTGDGKRYKSDTINYPFSVLTQSVSAQPASPIVNDRYRIPTAATGVDWSGQDGKIGIYTAAGWRFTAVPIGRFLYVEDETAFYHRNASGAWTAGVGSIALGAGSVTLPMVLGTNASFVVKVENQTTATPPASPVAPVAYIVAPTPTGVWSTYSPGDLAICLVNNEWTRIVPAIGDEVYDKAKKSKVRWSGTAWEQGDGVWLRYSESIQAGIGSVTGAGGSTYNFNPSAAPPNVAGTEYERDNNSLTHNNKLAGSRFRITWSADIVWGSVEVSSTTTTVDKPICVGLRRDSETAFYAVKRLVETETLSESESMKSGSYAVTWNVVDLDGASHTYQVYILRGIKNGTSTNPDRSHYVNAIYNSSLVAEGGTHIP